MFLEINDWETHLEDLNSEDECYYKDGSYRHIPSENLIRNIDDILEKIANGEIKWRH